MNYTKMSQGTSEYRVVSPYPEKKEDARVDWEKHPGKKEAYSDFTLKFLSENRDEINKQAKKFDVPPVALAMAIGDELQTRKDAPYKARGVIDEIQDQLADITPISENSDIGAGNIRIKTAKKLRDLYNWDMDDDELKKYILSDKGTVHLGALALKEVKDIMDSHLDKENMPDYAYNQHLVEGYRQGPENRLEMRKKKQEEANERLAILKKTDALTSFSAYKIYAAPILDAYAAGENFRTHLPSVSQGGKEMIGKSQQELLDEAIKKEEEKLQPMKTGVSRERSEFRHQQAKWILDGEDTKRYGQKGLLIPR